MRSVVDRNVVMWRMAVCEFHMTLPIDCDGILNLDPSLLCNGEASRLLCGRGWILKLFRKVPGYKGLRILM